MPDLTTADRAAIERVVGQLESAWNQGDGVAFAAPFAEDADFVNIRAEHHRGRTAIQAGHVGIFTTIYAGSTNRYTMEAARLIAPDVALVHVHAIMDVPRGPVSGRHAARFSMVLTKAAGTWTIASFHNTLEAHQGPPR